MEYLDIHEKPIQGVPLQPAHVEEQPNTLIAAQLDAKKKMKEARDKKKSKAAFFRFISGRVSLTEKEVFMDNLSTMLKAGLALAAGLSTLAAEMRNKYFRSILLDMKAMVENGENFSAGLRRYPDVFPDILVATIEVGESSGLLSDVLGHMAQLLKAERALKSKIISALMYPMVVLVALVGVSLVLTFFVFPKLIGIFDDAGVKLPIVLIIVQTVIYLFANYGWYIGGGLVVLIVGVRIVFHLPGARYWLHVQMLKLPVAGSLIKEIALTRFTGNLKLLLTSGLPIIKSLETVAATASNLRFRRAIIDMSQELSKGVTLNAAMASRPALFPSIVVQLTKVGEETGELETILGKVSEYYDNRVNNVLTNLSSIIEPIMLVSVGIAVGFVAVSVIGPIYELTNTFGDTQ
ncbi:MAG: type II secretion system F family protein [Candidatus Komeilibacteria bacterium]